MNAVKMTPAYKNKYLPVGSEGNRTVGSWRLRSRDKTCDLGLQYSRRVTVCWLHIRHAYTVTATQRQSETHSCAEDIQMKVKYKRTQIIRIKGNSLGKQLTSSGIQAQQTHKLRHLFQSERGEKDPGLSRTTVGPSTHPQVSLSRGQEATSMMVRQDRKQPAHEAKVRSKTRVSVCGKRSSFSGNTQHHRAEQAVHGHAHRSGQTLPQQQQCLTQRTQRGSRSSSRGKKTIISSGRFMTQGE